MMIAITLVAGAAVFAWVNGQAAVTENAYGERIGSQVNYYNEQFSVVSVQFGDTVAGGCQQVIESSGNYNYCNQVSVAVYNTGNVSLTINDISISSVSCTSSCGATDFATLHITSNNNAQATPSQTCNVGNPQPFHANDEFSPTASITPGSGPTVLTVTLPATCYAPDGQNYNGILVGASYQVQVVGKYGNAVTMQVTAGD